MCNTPLTFAIPYYRGKDLLVRTIESVRSQRNPCWELVVCDDSDGEEGIGDLVAGCRDRRIRYHKNASTLGLAGNWNTCLREATTDLVTVLHADDLLLENYCDVMLQAASDYPGAAGYFCNALIIDQRGRKIVGLPEIAKRIIRPRGGEAFELSGREGIALLLHGNFIVCPTVCYRRPRLGPHRFNSRWHFCLDLDLYTTLLLGGEKFVGVPATAYAYRRHAGSATARQSKTLRRFVEEIQFYDRMAEVAHAHGWDDVAAVAHKKRIIWLHLFYCVVKDVMGLRLRDAGRKLAILRRRP
jgi:glycosyltransferase involved in cell wall biosynthesis